MPDLNETDLSAQLENAFTDATPAAEAPQKAKPEPLPTEVDEQIQAAEAETDEAAPDKDDAPAEQEAAADDGLEFEIEVDGKREFVRGKDKVRELLQKGMHYGRGSEEVARAREALIAQSEMLRTSSQFNQVIVNDLTELKALEQQLEQWKNVDWNAEFDRDAFQALKYREQRDSLKERLSAKRADINAKQEQFKDYQSKAMSQMLSAEAAALTAKLPEWRNSETASKEQKAIASLLKSAGFTDQEIGSVADHRMLLIARKAMLYDQHVANRDVKVKQVREAVPTVRPGANQPPGQKGKTEFLKERATLKALGKKGQTNAQERLAEKMLSRVFKI